ncbi:unnamed protein product [Rotaria sp. Silwood1]|nr:unnamed protein product [Rotaria sp. Silwood1]CAF3424876.1 unnamed protein product [Rotaria sp. Silwood1]CAF3427045.1 unnamed protein product [Rotaria sp. Silwood1]CAF3427256.1 unnamed protein product [Rotaria sp. Silwood1]CAF4537780.1 unnamed protein product [Rotaria sp. Silwood1]
MTVLPYLDIKATPIRSVESPRSLRTQSLPRITNPNNSPRKQSPKSSDDSNKLSTTSSLIRSSIPPARTHTPKIKITRRSDDILKKLPHEKTDGIREHNAIWKPLTRELPDYDFLWEPLQREDIRHQYDFYIAPQRIIASRPDEPFKMTTMFETEHRHHHNYKRVRAMQQRQWNKEHIQYTIYPYSKIVEREMYNKHIRSTLKEQMEEKIQADKNEQLIKSLECQNLIQRDRQDLEDDKQKQNKRAQLLFKVTTRNKELMENKWEYDQWNRIHQWHVERTILADDPINWSKTMT